MNISACRALRRLESAVLEVARLTGKRRQTTHDLYREILFHQLEHAEGGDFAAQVWKILYGSFLELPPM